MFYYLAQYVQDHAAGTQWEDTLSWVRLFRYITFRTAGAAMTALILSWWLGPKVIAWLKRLKFAQNYLDKAEESGDLVARLITKKGTPTMGGVLIVMVMDLSAILWTQWTTMVQLTLLSVIILAGLGFYDDWAKITRQSSEGTTSYLKLAIQGILAMFIALYLYLVPATRAMVTDLMVPFVKHPVFSSALMGIPVILLTIVGSSNAVNLTDGLDGLAIGCTVIVSFVFLILTYVAGNIKAATYLQVPYVPGAGELTVFCAAMIGAGLGFLWFNCHPAQVFMGDTGSLALGGALGLVAVLIRQPLLLVIAGGVFVAEALSVMLQVGWFKYTRRTRGEGQRLFLRSPLHHHFEKKGWYESQVVTRFYILCIVCGVVALSTLKIR
jgi:phospho-N-acetylmuramoyl-pentapeptide-transferase